MSDVAAVLFAVAFVLGCFLLAMSNQRASCWLAGGDYIMQEGCTWNWREENT